MFPFNSLNNSSRPGTDLNEQIFYGFPQPSQEFVSRQQLLNRLLGSESRINALSIPNEPTVSSLESNFENLSFSDQLTRLLTPNSNEGVVLHSEPNSNISSHQYVSPFFSSLDSSDSDEIEDSEDDEYDEPMIWQNFSNSETQNLSTEQNSVGDSTEENDEEDSTKENDEGDSADEKLI